MKFTPFYNPVTVAFTSKTPSDLKCFYDDFIINIPYCLDELIQMVWRTPGFEDWNADFSPESLGGLGEWVATKVYKRDESLGGEHRSSPLQQSSIVVCLSEEEEALAVKVGMYYGEVAVRNNPSLSWFQLKGSKKLADYGQPVKMAFQRTP
jgi:hypothetical protein